MSTTNSTSNSTFNGENTNPTTTLPNITNLAPIKLDEDNYLNWKYQIVTILKTLGLLKFMNKNLPVPAIGSLEREEWDKQDGYVSAFITAHLSSSLIHLARGTSNSADLWKNLEESFSQQLFAKQNQFRTQFYLIRQNGRSINDYCNEAKFLIDSLQVADDPIPESHLVFQVLQGLDSQFESFVTNIENNDLRLNFNQLRAKLLTHESRMKQQASYKAPPIAAMAAMNLRPPHQTSSANSDVQIPCQICSKIGHQARQCYYRYTPSSQGRDTSGGSNYGSGSNNRNRWRGNSNFSRWRGNNGNRGGRNVSGGRISSWNNGGGGNQSANVAFGNNPNFSGCSSGPPSDPKHSSYSHVPGPTSYQPGPSNSDATFSNTLGSGPNSQTDQAAFMGFGSSSSNPFVDSPQFGPTHFQTWAAGNNSHYGYSATLSDMCHTVESWIPDSGATAHMTSDISMVHGAVPYTGSEQVIVGNDVSRGCPPPHAS
ncbi:uncharacterized protein LOC143555628 [Bidens hawaiensis]|uniref:uncharacterized protein LOC143555628 n=1 Tax=Bidens hawaiensis TaxID=980011 RepID=UPI004048F198